MANQTPPSIAAATPSVSSFDVLVVGAGMAGLACARTLAEHGKRVCVLEASSRVGGRIRTERVGDQVIELGAEFVHGRPPELLALIAEAGLDLIERTGSQLSFEDGRLVEDSDRGAMFAPLERLRHLSGPDRSFADFLADPGYAIDDATRDAATGYVEGFNAADADQISALSLGIQQQAEDDIDGENLAHIAAGYDRLPEFLAERLLAAGGEVRTGVAVSAMHWGVGRVAAETTAGEFLAPQAVVAVPLGVLASGGVRLVPEPRSILNAAKQMRMGPVCRFTLLFRERFWETLRDGVAAAPVLLTELSFLFDAGRTPAVWWTAHPEQTRSLTGWVGGPDAVALLHLSSQELGALGCRALARIFQLPETLLHEQLEACLTYDWSADPCSLGAYSYVAVGGIEASRQMSQPVEHTLYFAGEHTDQTGHWGTVHGALRSGLRAARQILGTE